MLLELLQRHGCTVGRQSAPSAGTLASGHDKPLSDPSLWHPEGPAPVLAAMKADPDDYDYDGWVEQGFAYKAALGPDREDYYGEFEDWSLQHPEGTPEATRKLWDSITTSRIGWRYIKYPPETEFSDAPEAAEENMPADPGDAAIEAILSRYLYVCKQDRFFDTHKRAVLTCKHFCSTNTLVAPMGVSGVKSADNVFLNHPGARKHAGFTYRPGQELVIDDEVNTWRPSTLVPIAGDAGPWLRHVSMLLPDPAQANHFLDWCAFVLQRPGRKINHALVLCTEAHGAGKDTALSPLRAGVGGHNYVTTSPAALCGTFTGFLEGQVIYVPEMKNYTKGEVYNNLKMWLARPPETVSVRKMRMDAYEIPNEQNWIFTTNSGDAIGLEQGDRRLWVGDCVGVPKENKAYYKALWGWLDADGRAIAVAHLLARDLSAFDPGDAPMTGAKQDMIDLATPAPVRWLHEQFEPEGLLHGRAILSTAELRELADDGWQSQPLRDVQITAALQAHGFRKLPGKHRIDGKPRNVWTTLWDPGMLTKGDVSVAARLAQDKKKKGA